MAPPRLSIDVLLHIIELADVEDVVTMERIPYLRAIIDQHRTSIMLRKHHAFELPACGRTHSRIIHYIYDDSEREAQLKTWTYIIQTDEYNSLISVLDREREIEVLLNAPYLRLRRGPGSRPIPWPMLDDVTSLNLRYILKRALYRCDAMANMEAHAVCELDAPLPSKYTLTTRDPGKRAMPGGDDPAEGLSEKLITQDVIPVATRRKQRAYITSLPDHELCGLLTLLRIVAQSWREFRVLHWINAGHPLDDNALADDDDNDNVGNILPEDEEEDEDDDENDAENDDEDGLEAAANLTWFEKEIAFQETLLRHGSYFLFAEVRGHGARYVHGKVMLNVCYRQIRQFQSGQRRINYEAGLHMTLMTELRKRLRVPTAKVESAVFDRVAKRIGAPKSAFSPGF